MADSLSEFREKFIFPQHDGKDALSSGNSLGLQPRSALDAIKLELDDWAKHGVDGHFRARNPWVKYHELFSKNLSEIVGAKPSSCCDERLDGKPSPPFNQLLQSEGVS